MVLLQVLEQSPDRVDLVESAIRAFSAAHQLQPTNEDVLYNYAISLIKVYTSMSRHVVILLVIDNIIRGIISSSRQINFECY